MELPIIGSSVLTPAPSFSDAPPAVSKGTDAFMKAWVFAPFYRSRVKSSIASIKTRDSRQPWVCDRVPVDTKGESILRGKDQA